jgi:hypothetical protein
MPIFGACGPQETRDILGALQANRRRQRRLCRLDASASAQQSIRDPD